MPPLNAWLVLKLFPHLRPDAVHHLALEFGLFDALADAALVGNTGYLLLLWSPGIRPG